MIPAEGGTYMIRYDYAYYDTKADVKYFDWQYRIIIDGQIASVTDVSGSSYYYKAVCWAIENNITNGVSSTKFGPGVVCSRAQTVTFLYRALGE